MITVLIISIFIVFYVIDTYRFNKKLKRRYGLPSSVRKPARTEPKMDGNTSFSELEHQLHLAKQREASAITAKNIITIDRDKLYEDIQLLRGEITDLKKHVGSNSQITELEKELKRLRERGRLAVEQRKQAEAERDLWKARADQAEKDLISKKPGRNGDQDNKYQQLKRFIAKEFHPDHSTGSGIERAIRSETFKVIWAKVDQLDRI